jgi:hypothetical protein
VKTIAQQVHVMRRLWPQFAVTERSDDHVVWIGPLVGIERPYKLVVEFGLPRDPVTDDMFRRFPVVRVLSPALEPNFDAEEEAPLPHVYFNQYDLTLSALCLFDPDKNEWSHNDFIARTTIPWAADWLACYECWLATGRWFGGGRHASQSLTEEVSA